MFINEAYETGKKIKKALQEKNKNVRSAAYKIKEAKNKLDLCHTYLEILLEHDIQSGNEFMLDLLKEKTKVKDVQVALCMGLLSDDEEFICFAEASKRYNLADGVLRKKRERGIFAEHEIEKRGREWWVSTKALERIYEEK